jgi:hypothetical protein
VLYADRAVTRLCIDAVCGAHGHLRLCVLAVGCLDAVSSVFGRLYADRAVTRLCIDAVCGAHGHLRLCVLAVGCLGRAEAADIDAMYHMRRHCVF